MKHISKTYGKYINRRGETLIEVLVAFTVLSIMLVVFAEGIAWATQSEMNATNSRTSADDSMKEVQTKIAAGNYGSSNHTVTVGDGTMTAYICSSSDGQHSYVVYRPASGG